MSMRTGCAAALVLALGAPALAAECPLHRALYSQPGNEWVLKFLPVPETALGTQMAAFQILSPGDPATVLDGEIHIPNGFGQPAGYVTLNCAADTECEPFWEGAMYALVDGGITEFPWNPDLPRDQLVAPDQVLLPELAANVWYSLLRESAFAQKGVLDTFTFSQCVGEP